MRVAAGKDLLGEKHRSAINTIDFKVSTVDGGLFVVEITNHLKGGPGRHKHLYQDELFYILEGDYILEVGSERFRLGPGDSVLGPRNVPHVWAFVGTGQGRQLVVFTPAGKLEAFFQKLTKLNSALPQDPELFRAHDMELLGPPLSIE